jgi:pimeloyl-ACP methyl ester carboxylesterase
LSLSRLPIFDFGGSGQPVHLSVANGFPPETYQPIFAPLSDQYRVMGVMPRALWPDAPAPETLISWQDIATDILQCLKEQKLTGVIAVGHSMGGVASTFAALREPSRFKALILLDPTFLPPRYLLLIAISRLLGQGHRFPLSLGALRRRTRFDSVEQAYDYWRSKPLFADWPDDALRLYAASLTRPAHDGPGLELSWTPAWEAHYYQKVYLRWPLLVTKLRGLLPVLIIQGATTNSFENVSRFIVSTLLPEATIRSIKRHGHLFPQSAPGETREIIMRWLADQNQITPDKA